MMIYLIFPRPLVIHSIRMILWGHLFMTFRDDNGKYVFTLSRINLQLQFTNKSVGGPRKWQLTKTPTNTALISTVPQNK